jgi:hypothetical protein
MLQENLIAVTGQHLYRKRRAKAHTCGRRGETVERCGCQARGGRSGSASSADAMWRGMKGIDSNCGAWTGRDEAKEAGIDAPKQHVAHVLHLASA